MPGPESLLEAFTALNERKRWRPEEMSRGDWQKWKQMRCEIESELFQKERDPSSDSREHLRVPVTLEARYWSQDELRDRYIPVLGEGGLFISTVDPLPVGSVIDLELSVTLKNFTFPIQGQVVWISEEDDPARRGMGIQFVNLSYEQKQIVYALVDDSLRQHLMERRRFARIDARLRVEIVRDEGRVQLYTEDVGLGGIFVATDVPLAVGERVELALHLPGGLAVVPSPAQVVRVVEKGTPGRPRGMGLRFAGLAPEGVDAIRHFLNQRVIGAVTPTGGDLERRRTSRVKRRIQLRFQVGEAMVVSYTKDISSSGAFVFTHDPPPRGSRIKVTLVHPVSRQELWLSGRVVRVVPHDPFRVDQMPGVGVVFDEPREERRQLLLQYLQDFASLGADETDEDA